MAEDSSQEKTHDPSQRRKQEAREKGTVLRSRELNSTLLLLMGAMGLLFFGPHLLAAISTVMQQSFNFNREMFAEPANMMSFLGQSCLNVGLATLPILCILLAAAVIGAVALGGWNFSLKSLMPTFTKMNPASGLKRMISAKSLMELIKALLKFSLVLLFGFIFIKVMFVSMLGLEDEPVVAGIYHGVKILGVGFIVISLSMVVVTLIDVPFQIWDHNKKLKMSSQEVKEEMKDTEGKPEVKSKIRQLQYGISQRRMMSEIKNANVILINPEHYSVALYYDKVKSPTPKVVAKGVDFVAFKIREVANKHQVEIVSSPALARSLYYTTKLNQEIPTGLYIAVAQVLAYVYQLRRYNVGLSDKPNSVKEVEIPEELRHD